MRVSERRLRTLLGRFSRVRVLVVGDLMLDQFVFGRVERISPEAPVPVVHVGREELRPGGAGNVVSNVRALGGRAAACGLVGRDAAGDRLRRALQATGASTAGMLASRDRRTTQKTRIIAHQQQVVRLDHEDGGPPGPNEARRLRDVVLRQLTRADVLVVSDYGKGVIGPELLRALADARDRHGFTWLIDPKRANFPHYRRASLIKPNREEAAEASGIDIRDAASLRAAGERLLARWEAESVLISQGEWGMALFKHGPRGGVVVEEFPTVAQQVFDVTGAGDTVLATCALALGAGGSLEEATVLANQAAGVVVGRIGTATTTTAELRDAIGRDEDPVRSMTGYGAGAAEAPTARVTVEVRSLNQRFLDVRVTAPREFGAFEREVRDRVRAVAERGRVEVTIARSAQAARRRYAVSTRLDLARAYVAAARDLARRLRLDGVVSVTDVLRLPDLFEVREVPPETRGEHATLTRAVRAALRAFDAERRREGAHLQRDMRQRVAHLKRLTAEVRRRLPRAVAALRQQVEERLVRLVGAADLDRARVAQEVAALAERSDVTEELVRLEAHLAALAAALGAPGAIGKRIEFLLQEVQRELNTTSAKAGDPRIVDLALVAKGEVERLREQVQNVE